MSASGLTEPSSPLYYMRRYKRPLPLIGSNNKQCLKTLLEEILPNYQAHKGKVIRIVGEGGMGKSEILEQLKYYFYGAPAIPGLAEKKPKAAYDRLLFGGVIDLYDPNHFFGRGIQQTLIDNWQTDYERRYLKAGSSPSRNNLLDSYAPKTYFTEDIRYEKSGEVEPGNFLGLYEEYRRTRFAQPNLEKAEDIIAQRNLRLDKSFTEALKELLDRYIPVICLDTTELLIQRDFKGQVVNDENDSLNWLLNFLKSPEREGCIVILAGRPISDELDAATQNRNKDTKAAQPQMRPIVVGKNELGTDIEGRVEEVLRVDIRLRNGEIIKGDFTLNELLKQVVPEKDYLVQELLPLNQDEVKEYIWNYLWFAETLFKSGPQQVEIKPLPTEQDYQQEPWHSKFEEFAANLEAFGVIQTDVDQAVGVTQSNPDRVTMVAKDIHVATGGKPILVDWLCQLYKSNQTRFLTPKKGEKHSDNKFRQDLVRFLFGDSAGYTAAIIAHTTREKLVALINPGRTLNGDEISLLIDTKFRQAIKYAFLFRRGMTLDLMCWLSEQSEQETKINREEGLVLLRELVDNPIFKVQIEGWSNSAGEGQSIPEITDEQLAKMKFRLHDEIYYSLYGQALIDEPSSYKDYEEEIQSLARIVAMGYRQVEFPTSFATIENALKELRTYNLQSGPEHRQPSNQPVPATEILAISTAPERSMELLEEDWFDAPDKIAKAIRLERDLQELLVDRLYYRLRGDFLVGYNEYCRLVNMAISEYQVSYSVRLQRQLLQYQQELRRLDREYNYEAKNPEKPYFLAARFYEGELRNVKRKFIVEPRATNSPQINQRRLNELVALANKSWSELFEDRQILAGLDNKKPLDASGELAMTGLSDRQKHFMGRLKLTKADALVSIYDHSDADAEGYERAKKALDFIKELEKDDLLDATLFINRTPGEAKEEDYFYWQTYMVKGRAYYIQGAYYQSLNYIEGAIEAYKQAVQAFKNAVTRITVPLNDTRNSISFVYAANGQLSIGRQIVSLALNAFRLSGNKVFVALSEIVLAQNLLSTDNDLEEAFRLAQRALTRFGDYAPAERKQLQAYQLILQKASVAARRLARHYADSNNEDANNLIYIHLLAKSYLDEYYEASVKPALDQRAENLDTILEWQQDCAAIYRSLGRTLNIVVRNDPKYDKPFQYDLQKGHKKLVAETMDEEQPLIRRFDALSQQAEVNWRDVATELLDKGRDLYKDVVSQCTLPENQASVSLLRKKIESQIDLAQLESYYRPFEVMGLALFNQLEADLERFAAIIKDPTQPELAVQGWRKHYAIHQTTKLARQADYNWKAYKYEEKSEAEKSAYLQNYFQCQTLALSWLYAFQPNVVNDQGDYGRDIGYVSRIERRLGEDITTPDLRQALHRFGQLFRDKDLKKYIENIKASAEPNSASKELEPNIAGGFFLLVYINDMHELIEDRAELLATMKKGSRM